MGFRESLIELCARVPGALAASVMGYDGVPVETHEVDAAKLAPPQDVSIATAMVEYSSIFGQVRQAAAQLQAGEASEVSIRTEKLVAVARTLSPEYFVMMALVPEGNLGKARYALRVGAAKLAAEL
jgi:predicted regulator of Ras-like GTPase activity (Roadblock/LC7/MglB family)